MKVDDTKEDLYFEGFNPADLQKNIRHTKKRSCISKEEQRKEIIQYLYLY